jgi:hypothetical protein
MVAGRPFMILDAIADFGEADENGRRQVALLVQFCTDSGTLLGESFVFTRNSSPSRLRLVELVHEALVLGDTAGPCAIRLIEQSDPSRKPFQHIGRYEPESRPARETVPVGVGYIDQEDIPW